MYKVYASFGPEFFLVICNIQQNINNTDGQKHIDVMIVHNLILESIFCELTRAQSSLQMS